MDRALIELMNRIADGEEFPDALWVVCKRHEIDAQELRDAYDEECVRLSRHVHHPAASVKHHR